MEGSSVNYLEELTGGMVDSGAIATFEKAAVTFLHAYESNSFRSVGMRRSGQSVGANGYQSKPLSKGGLSPATLCNVR